MRRPSRLIPLAKEDRSPSGIPMPRMPPRTSQTNAWLLPVPRRTGLLGLLTYPTTSPSSLTPAGDVAVYPSSRGRWVMSFPLA